MYFTLGRGSPRDAAGSKEVSPVPYGILGCFRRGGECGVRFKIVFLGDVNFAACGGGKGMEAVECATGRNCAGQGPCIGGHCR